MLELSAIMRLGNNVIFMGKTGLSHEEEGWKEVWDEKPVITFIEVAHLQTTGKIRQLIVTGRVASCNRKYAYESCLPFIWQKPRSCGDGGLLRLLGDQQCLGVVQLDS